MKWDKLPGNLAMMIFVLAIVAGFAGRIDWFSALVVLFISAAFIMSSE